MANAHVAIGPFAGLTFLACYLSGKIKVFDRRGHVAKLCLLFLPILVAVLIGISRVDDYWPERSSEYLSLLSFASTFFPYPFDDNGWAPHVYFRMLAEKSGLATTMTHGAVLEGCWTKTSSLVPPTCRTIMATAMAIFEGFMGQRRWNPEIKREGLFETVFDLRRNEGNSGICRRDWGEKS
ncbi:hypothetical protein DY000_02042517 [Brassica cretica]|uniref:Uncharacterized protein n=1 Tax=Brassica cretica TaxID=69181 RepID=A0ABQ7BM98_BRACR|nr:hypothetical protein DY000_02042517 [Brassica cretica]